MPYHRFLPQIIVTSSRHRPQRTRCCFPKIRPWEFPASSVLPRMLPFIFTDILPLLWRAAIAWIKSSFLRETFRPRQSRNKNWWEFTRVKSCFSLRENLVLIKPIVPVLKIRNNSFEVQPESRNLKCQRYKTSICGQYKIQNKLNY